MAEDGREGKESEIEGERSRAVENGIDLNNALNFD